MLRLTTSFLGWIALGVATALASGSPAPESWFDSPPETLAEQGGLVPCSTDLGEEVLESTDLTESQWPHAHLYGSKIVGEVFGTDTTSVSSLGDTGTANATVFAAAYAGGLAFERPGGLIRWECECMLREVFNAQASQVAPGESFRVRAADNWSVLTNAWRDISITDRVGVYGGGGIGAGGYRLTVNGSHSSAYRDVAAFAWQAGGGLTYVYNAHLTLDLGYRFLDMGTTTAPLTAADGAAAGTFNSSLSASEVLLTLRVFDPFRWAGDWHDHLLPQ